MQKKYKVIIVAGIGVFIAVMALIFVREASPLVTAPASPTPKLAPLFTSPARIKALIEIRILSKKGSDIEISIHWENLPEGTTALDIFRSLSQDSIGILVKTLSIDENSLAVGNAIVTVSGGQGSYFHATAISDNGSILWTSPSTQPTIASSSQQSPASGLPPAPVPAPLPQLLLPPPPSQPSQPSSTSSSTITYYTPQGTISGSSTPQTANFWVQHVDQKIQVGWQNIPSDIDRLIVSRSESTDGPWTAILTQTNPVTEAPYSLQIVDHTLNDPYYYKLDTYHGSTLVTSYGPILLDPISE